MKLVNLLALFGLKSAEWWEPRDSYGLSDEGIVDLNYVRYAGKQDLSVGVTTFYGLHYAHAPVGSRRWRAPVPIEDNSPPYFSSGVQDASVSAPSCIQGVPDWSAPGYPDWEVDLDAPSSEDCLTLNVQVPMSVSQNSSLPVLLDIHGGGYLAGSSGDQGSYMIQRSNGSMIYVSINYRLGLYGFLAGKEVRKDGDLNAGLLDQRAAIEWVYRHISAFGGDPEKIILIGDSAGGGSVSYQLAFSKNDKRRPFRGAIIQAPWGPPLLSEQTQQQLFDRTLAMSGCDSLDCLRSLDEEALRMVSQETFTDIDLPQYGHGLFLFSPVVDNKFVTHPLSQVFSDGHHADVPLMITRATKEGEPFTSLSLMAYNQTRALTESLEEMQRIFPLMDTATMGKFLSYYPPVQFPNVFDHRARWFGDAMINCGSYNAANSPNLQPKYKLVFEHGGLIHSSAAPYIYSSETEASVLDKHTSHILVQHIVDFVTTGSLSTAWPQYGTDKTVLQMSVEGQKLIHDPDDTAQCHFILESTNILSI